MRIYIVLKNWSNLYGFDCVWDEFVEVFGTQRSAKKFIWNRYDEEREDVKSNDDLSLTGMREYGKEYYDGHVDYRVQKPIYSAAWTVDAKVAKEDGYNVAYVIIEREVKG